MKIRELKENEPLNIIEVSKQYHYPSFIARGPKDSDTYEEKKIKMKVFTDGEIEKQTEETSQNINE